jgi:hypothetical protein
VCVPADGGNARYNPGGEIYNPSDTADVWISCPMIHDNTGLDDYKVTLSFWDGNASEDIQCYAEIRDLGSPALVTSVYNYTSGMGRKSMTLTAYSSDSSTYNNVKCKLPNRGDWGSSYVSSIDYEEL